MLSQWEIGFTFGAQHCQKYALHQKTLQIKVVQIWILYKKVHGRICQSASWVELGSFTDQYVWNFIMYRNGKLDSLSRHNIAKNTHYIKKVSNKSCSELNFIQKSPRVHTCSELNFIQKSSRVHTYVYLSHEWSQGAPKISMFKIL